ncbi:MAG: hypothetical protein B7Z15_06655 [Rhizobiales bacterium 32-66-8]|nr:MAG: hypothetical protein B7Z15_06655 [Rhizobiales bacterium 32-66-8]
MASALVLGIWLRVIFGADRAVRQATAGEGGYSAQAPRSRSMIGRLIIPAWDGKHTFVYVSRRMKLLDLLG